MFFQGSIRYSVAIMAFFGFASGLIFEAKSHAAPQYVSDVLVISLRSGKDTESEVIGYLKSSQPVEILAQDATVAKIRTENGTVGWVQKRFLVSERPKSMVIEDLKRENAALKKKLRDLESAPARDEGDEQPVSADRLEQVSELKENAYRSKEVMQKAEKELTDLLEEHAILRTKNQAIADQLQTASPPTDQLEAQIQVIRGKGIPVPRKENLLWFMIGSVIMLIGFVVGFLSRRKKVYHY